MPPLSPERMELSRRRKEAHDALSAACDDGSLADHEVTVITMASAAAGGDPGILERGVALAHRRRAAKRAEQVTRYRRDLEQIDAVDCPEDVWRILMIRHQRILKLFAEWGVDANPNGD